MPPAWCMRRIGGCMRRLNSAQIAVTLVLLAAIGALASQLHGRGAADETYEVAILNGRVMDPESGLGAVRSVGIAAGKIAVISANRISATSTIDAKGLVIAPGFIDLHEHG